MLRLPRSARLSRRELLCHGGALAAGLTKSAMPFTSVQGGLISPRRAKAKSVIVLYLHGGAPTQDMFDMKPAAPVEVRGEFSPIDTSAPGVQVCEHLPRMARWMHRAALVRSVNHRGGCHNEIPSFTGNEDPRGPEMQPENLPPSMGSVCEFLKSADDLRPAYVFLPNPLSWLGETGPGAGFLGRRFDPLMTTCDPHVDQGASISDRPNPPPLRGRPRINDTQLVDGLALDRVGSRKQLLSSLDGERHRMASSEAAGFDRFQQRAFDLLASPELRACFDPAQFDESVRQRYGDTVFGNAAFTATRLVQSGVRFVNVTWTWYNSAISGLQDFGWDTHEHNFSILRHYLPQLDLVYDSLLTELDANGLLDETLVVVMSDFGRTPGVNRTAGRDHWTYCYSVLLAGAGIRGGTVYGASDKHAAIPVDQPVSPADICATIYECLGIDPDTMVHDRLSRPHKIAQGGEAIHEILA
jgi:hypothetical protein